MVTAVQYTHRSVIALSNFRAATFEASHRFIRKIDRCRFYWLYVCQEAFNFRHTRAHAVVYNTRIYRYITSRDAYVYAI